MKQISKWFGSLSLLLSLVLSGCGAVQFAEVPVAGRMSIMASVQGMRAAVDGAAGTFAYSNPTTGWVALAWPQGSRYGFIIIDQAGNVLKNLKDVCGTACNWQEAADFTAWMERTGWARVAAPAIPTAITGSVRQIAYLLSIGATLPALPVIFIIPTTLNPIELLNPGGPA